MVLLGKPTILGNTHISGCSSDGFSPGSTDVKAPWCGCADHQNLHQIDNLTKVVEKSERLFGGQVNEVMVENPLEPTTYRHFFKVVGGPNLYQL